MISEENNMKYLSYFNKIILCRSETLCLISTYINTYVHKKHMEFLKIFVFQIEIEAFSLLHTKPTSDPPGNMSLKLH